jgi:hypothetical protein
MTDFFAKIPAPIRSLWHAEAELRRGLWASILKRDQPNPHYHEARRHFNEALAPAREPVPDAEKGKWGSADHVAATVEQDRIDEASKKPHDPSDAPRF